MISTALVGILLSNSLVGRGDADAGTDPTRPGAPDADSICEVVQSDMPLPDVIRETSGLAWSGHGDHVFWTHNDGGHDAELFAIDADGALVERVRVAGADVVDWEDVEAIPCGDFVCLYVGDIGDNDGDRDRITIYRVEEPPAGAAETRPAEALHARFPDGPRDAEGLFGDRSGNLFVVSKGRHGHIALYRYPGPQQADQTVTLERVRDLFPPPADGDDRVTAATTSPDGRWVGIRTYRTLYLYPSNSLIGNGPVEPEVVDLGPLAEPQGEALVLLNDGTVWVTSEAGGGAGPRWSRLRCAFPDQ